MEHYLVCSYITFFTSMLIDSQKASGNFMAPGLLDCMSELDLPKSDFDFKTED